MMGFIIGVGLNETADWHTDDTHNGIEMLRSTDFLRIFFIIIDGMTLSHAINQTEI